MKSITKILIAFLTITMIITPAMGCEPTEDQLTVWEYEQSFDDYNQLIHHRTLQVEGYHPMPTGLDDLRAGYNSPDPQKYF